MADTISYARAIVHARRWSISAAVAIQIGSFGAYLTRFSGGRTGTGLGVLAMTSAGHHRQPGLSVAAQPGGRPVLGLTGRAIEERHAVERL